MKAFFLAIAASNEIILATLSIIVAIVISLNETKSGKSKKKKKKKKIIRWVSLGSFLFCICLVFVAVRIENKYTRTPNLIGLTYVSAMEALNDKDLQAIPIVTGKDSSISDATGNCVVWQYQEADSILEKGEKIIFIADNSITHSLSMLPLIDYKSYALESQCIDLSLFGVSSIVSVKGNGYIDKSELKMHIMLYTGGDCDGGGDNDSEEIYTWEFYRRQMDTEIPSGRIFDENGNQIADDPAYGNYSIECNAYIFSVIVTQVNRYFYFRNTGIRVSDEDENITVSAKKLNIFPGRNRLFVIKLVSLENDSNTIIYYNPEEDYYDSNTIYIYPEFLDEGEYIFYAYCITLDDGNIYDIKVNLSIS